jgi:hypothetical protein
LIKERKKNQQYVDHFQLLLANSTSVPAAYIDDEERYGAATGEVKHRAGNSHCEHNTTQYLLERLKEPEM